MHSVILSLCLLVAASVVPQSSAAEHGQIQIVGLFHPEVQDYQDIAFQYAVDRINMNNMILPHKTLVKHVISVSEFDSFTMGKKVCNATVEGVAAIFGPRSSGTTGIVRDICSTLEIPNLLTHWDTKPRHLPTLSHINLHPDPQLLAEALVSVVQFLQWKSFTIIYETDEGLMKLQELLKFHNSTDSAITVRQLSTTGDYRPLLKDVHASLETHIILECSTDHILEILRQAKEVKMMEDYQSYFITSLDTHTLDLSEFSYTQTNITTLRLVDPMNPEVQNAVQDWIHGENRNGRKLDLRAETVRTETALMYDAVNLFAKALDKLDSNGVIETESLSCNHVNAWEHGMGVINFIKIVTMSHGMTGDIMLDQDGRRTHFVLDLLEHSGGSFSKVATWDPKNQMISTRTFSEAIAVVTKSLQNKTFIVSSRIGGPFLEWKLPKEGRVGNDRFEGYSMDLIHEVTRLLNTTYEFVLVPDEGYGSYNAKTKKWNGLVKELLDRKADLAICDLTITYERESAVDFTMPFMNLGISILFSKPVKEPPRLFSFLAPFSFDVWIYMATAYLGVSVLLFGLARMTPHEWANPHPCNPAPEELENTFNLLNCMWLALGSLMGQGCDLLPRAVSTRMVAGMWWFFTLIMISSYTANLAAFLTVSRMDNLISSVEDLAKQTKIKYGTVKGGSTAGFFEKSNFSTYQRMWTQMQQARPEVFVKSNDEGKARVKDAKGGYAFFMESTSIEYMVERNCDLQQIGGLLDSKGYGIAMPVNSPYRTVISGAVLTLQEQGILNSLKKRWWKEKGGGICDAENAGDADVDSNELGLPNVGGVFVVLISGCFTAFFITILEFLWNCRKIAVEEAISPWEALVMELQFAFHCSGTTKPVRKKQSEPDENNGGSSIQLNFDKYDK